MNAKLVKKVKTENTQEWCYNDCRVELTKHWEENMFTHTYQESQAYQHEMQVQACRERQIRLMTRNQQQDRLQGRAQKGFLRGIFSL